MADASPPVEVNLDEVAAVRTTFVKLEGDYSILRSLFDVRRFPQAQKHLATLEDIDSQYFILIHDSLNDLETQVPGPDNDFAVNPEHARFLRNMLGMLKDQWVADKNLLKEWKEQLLEKAGEYFLYPGDIGFTYIGPPHATPDDSTAPNNATSASQAPKSQEPKDQAGSKQGWKRTKKGIDNGDSIDLKAQGSEQPPAKRQKQTQATKSNSGGKSAESNTQEPEGPPVKKSKTSKPKEKTVSGNNANMNSNPTSETEESLQAMINRAFEVIDLTMFYPAIGGVPSVPNGGASGLAALPSNLTPPLSQTPLETPPADPAPVIYVPRDEYDFPIPDGLNDVQNKAFKELLALWRKEKIEHKNTKSTIRRKNEQIKQLKKDVARYQSLFRRAKDIVRIKETTNKELKKLYATEGEVKDRELTNKEKGSQAKFEAEIAVEEAKEAAKKAAKNASGSGGATETGGDAAGNEVMGDTEIKDPTSAATELARDGVGDEVMSVAEYDPELAEGAFGLGEDDDIEDAVEDTVEEDDVMDDVNEDEEE